LETDVIEYQTIVQPLADEDGGGYLVRVPELPGCMADGKTIASAIKDAESAIEQWIVTATKLGRPIPKPGSFDSYSGKWLQRVPKRLHMELVAEAEREGVSLNQLVVSLVSEGLGRKTAG
jgi:antitoxin HicB